MAKKLTLAEMRERDKQLMAQHKEMQDMIRKAEAAEREHIAADIVQACMEMSEQMPEDIRPEMKDIPNLIRKMWEAYYGLEKGMPEGQEPSAGLPTEEVR
ncbi:MAG: hypothetical protein K6G81_05345 [Lachnospiraceae bacterium]|nr:hypothetical protein [Lachnospiraceae bacterium]